ncbi:MAG: cytochrome C [Aquificae bacterium]|nr:cytochrome C [Aquificota bacterium]
MWVLAVFLLVGLSFGGIKNSPHNLSVSGPGTIKAVSETEICIFCHIPHHSSPSKPLWNHLLSSAQYTLYDSDFMRRINYPAPQQPGQLEGEPGIVSRMCLSCHDGTVAIGAVYWVRGTNLFDIGQTIEMVGVDPSTGAMPQTATGYIGTDLTSHHPVAIPYDPNVVLTTSGGDTISVELNPTPPNYVRLYDYNGTLYVECTSCHDPHEYDPVVNPKFLRLDTYPTFGENVKNLCTACHVRQGWAGSAHATATNTYPDQNVGAKYGVNTVQGLGCINCHTPHKGLGVPYLLRWAEEATCFMGASSASSTSACHGTGSNSTKQIEPLLGRTYKHPIDTISGVHTNLDVLYGMGSAQQGEKGITFDQYRHSECVDCHNPHRAGVGNHVTANGGADNRDTVNAGWYPVTPTNNVSPALQGVSGVEPNWTGAGTQPTSYKVYANSTKEYQICFKCHSFWALGSATQWVTGYYFSDARTLPDGTPYPLTDVAAEFNPNNASGHPVVVSANNRPGSYNPKPLPPQAMREPWKSVVGNATMYCSDCHGADNEANADPRGPHGSNIKFMLKGPGKYWPKDPNGNFFTPDGILSGTQNVDDLFCNNCHDIPWIMQNVSPHNSWRGRGVMQRAACVECHVAIPHGSPVSRLIGYDYFPAPYNYRDDFGNPMLKLRGFRKDYDGGSWNLGDRLDAWSLDPSCSRGRGCHSTNAGGYDCYPDSPFVSNCGDFNPPP